MKRRTAILVVAMLVAGLAGSFAILFKPFEDGPRYKGLPVSSWRSAIIRWKRGNFASNSGPVGLRLQSFFGLCTPGGQPSVLGGDPLGPPVLLHLLRDKDEFVRNPVMYALMELPPDKALWNGVKELLQDDDSGVRSSGGRLLLHLGREAGAEAVPVVIELLQSEDTNVRTEAINILLHLGPDAAPAVPVLVKMLKKEWPLRYYAARALPGIGREAESGCTRPHPHAQGQR